MQLDAKQTQTKIPYKERDLNLVKINAQNFIQKILSRILIRADFRQKVKVLKIGRGDGTKIC